MSERLWGTQEDVLKDLEEVYGMRISGNQRDIFVQGEGPPPPMATDEDDLQDTFDGLQDYIAPPDLRGISQMLKIVKEHEKEDDYDDLPITGQPNQRVHHLITISKLNPNVPPFVPNAVADIMSNGTSKKADLKNVNKCNPKDNVKQGENFKNCANADQSVLNKISYDEREKMAEQLKNTISSNAKEDTFQSKKEKNIAISSLLKLYSKSQLNSSETPKLVTPDYYAKSKTETTKTPIEETVAVNNKCEMIISNSPDFKENEPAEATRNKNIDPINVEIEQSIIKVKNWLNPRTPTPKKQSYLGPPSFKRKEAIGCKSPNSTSEKTLSKSSTSTTAEYIPTEYADELAKKYSKRQKELEAAELKAMDPITKLELELKARDKLIRQRALEKSAS